MVPIRVTARFNPDGEIIPENFNWQGIDYPITSVGRHWQDVRGFHILVMVPGDQIFELVFVAAELVWYMGSLGAYRA
ncbi:MAG: hypothetical protein H6Q37_65 [Chloroflexi bacterium]|nr:hypothetical protein [Chloroflexota bacterium]